MNDQTSNTNGLRDLPENETVEAEHTPWMITLADLLSLMLTFFVLLFSMNQVAPDHWNAVVETMSDQFNPGRVTIAEQQQDTIVTGRVPKVRAGLNLSYLQTILEAQTEGVPALEVAQMWRSDGGLVISLPAALLFQDSSAELRPDSRAGIDSVARILQNIRNKALVIGNTALAEPGVGAYSDNWALSVARALAVAKRLQYAGYPGQVTATGLSSSHFDALDPDLSLDDRDGLSARVDIVILPDRRGRSVFELF